MDITTSTSLEITERYPYWHGWHRFGVIWHSWRYGQIVRCACGSTRRAHITPDIV